MSALVRNGRWWGRLGSVLTGLCARAHLAMVNTSAAHGGLIWRITALMAAVMVTADPLMRLEHTHGGTIPGGTVAAVALLLVVGAVVVPCRAGPRQARPAGQQWRLRRDGF